MLRQEDLPPSPIIKANFISKLFFWWLNEFFGKGNKGPLEITDMYQTLPNDKSKKLGDKMQILWSQQMNGKKKPSLMKVIWKQFGVYYMLMGLLAFIEECFTRIAQPLCLGFLIRYFAKEQFTETEGYLLATGVVAGSAFYTFTHHPYFFGVQHVGMQIRIGCCSLVYRKALKLSQASLGQTTIGQMVNLLSNDVNRFDQSTIFLHYLWVGPLQTAIVTGILWSYYGPSCLAGISILVLFVPFQGYMGRLFSNLRTSTAGKTDRRIRIMNEIVSGMRIIKMYTWEKPFAALVSESREDEIKMIRKTSRLRAINMSLFYTSSKVIIFLTLLTYVLTGHSLTAEKVFVTLSLINNVRLIMTLFFPNGVSQAAEALVSIKRLESFLLMEENVKKEEEKSETLDQTGSIKLENVTANWTPTQKTLTNINLSVRNRELIAIVGQVGSGKSSLLQTILKELPPTTGSVRVSGTLAYTCQEPWVFAGSVKDNILFGRDFNESWYLRVVEACALTRDLELLPYGDKTLVGDRGASLSGGQKARITLARAVYADSDIYLLDDPLSAVDAEVGRHLFENCICGILKNKTRILVTHQLQLLKNTRHIILLNEGRIKLEGNYDEISKTEISRSRSNSIMSLNRHRTRTISNGSILSLSYSFNRRRSSVTAGDGSLVGNMEFEEFDEEDEQQTEKLEVIVPKTSEESSSTGNIKFGLYLKYFGAGSGAFSGFMLILTNVLTQVLFTGSDWWLNFWTKAQQEPPPVEPSDPTYPLYTETNTQIYIYSSIIVALFIASLARTLIFFNICMSASVNLHKSMFGAILRAPMRFFELNPVGRILNRFSAFCANMDDILPPTFFDTIGIFLNVIGIMVIIGMVNPILLAPAGVLAIVFYYLRRFYLRTARSVKRVEGITRSPVFSHLSTSLYGLTTIRAFKTEEEFIRQFDDFQDMHTSVFYLLVASTRWLGVWLDWISVCFIAFVTYSFMLAAQGGAEVGLAVSSAMMLTGMFQWGVRQSAEVENQMVSVERVLEYTKLEPEAPLESNPPPDSNWPDMGEIAFEDVELKYGVDKPVLRNITCVIKPAEKIGIVGRTGAGKSSLITTLFRIAEPTGAIKIDGINVLKIGLHELRSKISIIPQDPVLFTGSLRKNLDPFNYYDDARIWSVLEDVHLASDVKQTVGLELEVSEGGSNFSVGQRQLVCLARAILKNNKVLVLDEATANVDPETDALIQQTIRTKFASCTVLTIAHRLHTVMDCDKIMVLDAGMIVEFDEPYTLLCDKNSSLYSLVQQTGAEDNLLQIAKNAATKRQQKLEVVQE